MDFAQRWLLMLAIATAIFAICLLLLRVNIRMLAILMGIGLSLVTLWMYMDARYLVRQEEIFHQNRPARVLYARVCNNVLAREMCMLLDYKR
jgi:hypothetical protein